jgi:hypothetical protein
MNRRRLQLSPIAAVLVTLAIATLVWLTRAVDVPQRPVMRAEFGELAVLVITTIVSLFKNIFGGVNAATKNALLEFRNTVVGLGNRIADVAATAGSWFKSIFDSTKKLWSRVLKPALLHITSWIRSLQQLLGRWFGPIIRHLKLIRDDVLKFYRKILRPILDTIDIVSRTLKLLGKLHVPGAAELGDKIAQFSDRVEGAVLTIVRDLNKVINQINNIITFNGLLQRVTLLRSLIDYKRDVMNFIARSSYREVSQETYQKYRSPVLTLTPEQHGAQLIETVEFGTGKLAPAAREQGQDLLRMLRR